MNSDLIHKNIPTRLYLHRSICRYDSKGNVILFRNADVACRCHRRTGNVGINAINGRSQRIRIADAISCRQKQIVTEDINVPRVEAINHSII